jgi:hypothetical protein
MAYYIYSGCVRASGACTNIYKSVCPSSSSFPMFNESREKGLAILFFLFACSFTVFLLVFFLIEMAHSSLLPLHHLSLLVYSFHLRPTNGKYYLIK